MDKARKYEILKEAQDWHAKLKNPDTNIQDALELMPLVIKNIIPGEIVKRGFLRYYCHSDVKGIQVMLLSIIEENERAYFRSATDNLLEDKDNINLYSSINCLRHKRDDSHSEVYLTYKDISNAFPDAKELRDLKENVERESLLFGDIVRLAGVGFAFRCLKLIEKKEEYRSRIFHLMADICCHRMLRELFDEHKKNPKSQIQNAERTRSIICDIRNGNISMDVVTSVCDELALNRRCAIDSKNLTEENRHIMDKEDWWAAERLIHYFG